MTSKTSGPSSAPSAPVPGDNFPARRLSEKEPRAFLIAAIAGLSLIAFRADADSLLNKFGESPFSIEKFVLFDPQVRVLLIHTDGISLDVGATSFARARVKDRVISKLRGKKFEVIPFAAGSAKERSTVDQYLKLHEALVTLKNLHGDSFLGGGALYPLPTVGPDTAYDLPPPKVHISPDIDRRFGTKFALMFNLRDEQKTSSKSRSEILEGLFIGSPYVPTPKTPFNIATASIVDLSSGTIVWSYTNNSVRRDLTDDAGINETIDALIEKLPRRN